MHDHGAMLDHGGLLAALPPGSIWALAASLFLVGLGGGFLHCAGMCGPFVLAQVGFRVDKTPGTMPPGLRRLTGGALLPYHFGRATTYTLLGALVGAIGSGIVGTTGWRWLPGTATALAALWFAIQAVRPFAGQALDFAPPRFLARLGDQLARMAASSGTGLYGFGVILGFLPCGMVYGALGAAAGAGSVAGAALMMLAFALGTMPALLVVGTAGAAALRGLRRSAGYILPALYLLNAALLAAMAFRSFV